MSVIRYLKPIIGVLLVTLSITLLVWWENIGREALTMQSVLVANREILPGEIIKKNSFIEVKSNDDAVVNQAIVTEDFFKINGKVAKQYIPVGSQVVESMFINKNQLLHPEISIFQIKEEWIGSRSSSLRKGDKIHLYDEQGEIYLGEFTLAYVKDSEEQEVVGTEQNTSEDIRHRDFSTSIISHIEIFSTLIEYQKIWEMAEIENIKLLIIQKGDNTSE